MFKSFTRSYDIKACKAIPSAIADKKSINVDISADIPLFVLSIMYMCVKFLFKSFTGDRFKKGFWIAFVS